MHKNKGKTVIALLAIAIVAAIAAVWVCTPGERVALFVRAHSEDLSDIASACLTGDASAESYRSVRVEGLFDGEHPIVQFDTYGWGLAPYMGFYYSPDGTPAAFQNVNSELTSVDDNTWKWTGGTDNHGMTKKIYDCWYYFEAWL